MNESCKYNPVVIIYNRNLGKLMYIIVVYLHLDVSNTCQKAKQNNFPYFCRFKLLIPVKNLKGLSVIPQKREICFMNLSYPEQT